MDKWQKQIDKISRIESHIKHSRINFDFSQKQYDEFRNNAEVVLEAIKKDWKALNFASDRLKDDKEFVLEAIKQNGYSLQFASDRLKDDGEVVLEAVKSYGPSLRFVSDRLKDDGEVVLEAVREDNRALNYASPRIQSLLENETDKVAALEVIINKEKLKDALLPKKEIKSKSLKM